MYQTLEERRKSAKVRQAERDGRTNQQQLARLDHMHGKGQGAAKERAKLAERIERAKAKKAETAEAEATKEHVAESKDEKKTRKRKQKS